MLFFKRSTIDDKGICKRTVSRKSEKNQDEFLKRFWESNRGSGGEEEGGGGLI